MKHKKIFLSEDKSITLDCYLYEISHEIPYRSERPAVLVCPGGGYNICSDREADPIAFGYSAAGFHTFILRYSLKEKATYPSPLIDLCHAMKTVRDNAEEWGVKKDQIAVCGFSAGGHLTASLGVHWNEEKIQNLSGVTAEDIKPNALILSYPVISSSWMENTNNLSRIIGNGDFDSTYKDINLHTCVGEHTPPSFIWHTFRDGCVPVRDSLKFAYALEENNIPFELHIWPNGAHGLSLANSDVCQKGGDRDSEQWFDLSVKWLKRLFYNTEEANSEVKKAKYSRKM